MKIEYLVNYYFFCMKIIKRIKFYLLIIFSISYFNNKIKNIIYSQLNKWIDQLYIFFHKNIICSQKKLDLSFSFFFLIKLLKSYLICVTVQGYLVTVEGKCSKCTKGVKYYHL